jgi:serine/threonine-protein kinase RsbW
MNAELLVVSADLRELDRVRAFVETQARALGASGNAVYDILLAVNELVTNIVLHGYRGAAGRISIELRTDGADLVVRIYDHAPPFDPTLFPAAGNAVAPGSATAGSIGILLARHFIDVLTYHRDENGGNELVIVKRNAC